MDIEFFEEFELYTQNKPSSNQIGFEFPLNLNQDEMAWSTTDNAFSSYLNESEVYQSDEDKPKVNSSKQFLFADSQAMIPEKTFPTEASTTLFSNSSESNTQVKQIHSKDCLKFCRRISKILYESLNATRTDNFISPFLTSASKVINSILAVAYGPESYYQIPVEDLNLVQTEILLKIWGRFKNLLSYHKNKKICIVKKEYWDVIFDRKVFRKYAKEACADLQKESSIKLVTSFEGIFNSFSDIMFSINVLMVLTLIMKDDTEECGQFLRKMEVIDNLLVLIIEPGLFEYYNHRSGKFPNECCGKCKICCSKNIPLSLGITVDAARKRVSFILGEIRKVVPKDAKEVKEEQLMYLLSGLIQQF